MGGSAASAARRATAHGIPAAIPDRLAAIPSLRHPIDCIYPGRYLSSTAGDRLVDAAGRQSASHRRIVGTGAIAAECRRAARRPAGAISDSVSFAGEPAATCDCAAADNPLGPVRSRTRAACDLAAGSCRVLERTAFRTTGDIPYHRVFAHDDAASSASRWSAAVTAARGWAAGGNDRCSESTAGRLDGATATSLTNDYDAKVCGRHCWACAPVGRPRSCYSAAAGTCRCSDTDTDTDTCAPSGIGGGSRTCGRGKRHRAVSPGLQHAERRCQ